MMRCNRIASWSSVLIQKFGSHELLNQDTRKRGMAFNLFSIPHGAPFLDRLAQGLIARHGVEALPELLILLPNRRSVSALGAAFVDAAKTDMILLPRIRAIG